jgi:hypothetical protein
MLRDGIADIRGATDRSRGGCGDFDKLVARVCCVSVALMSRWVPSVGMLPWTRGRSCQDAAGCLPRVMQALNMFMGYVYGRCRPRQRRWWGVSGTLAADLRMVSVACGGARRPNIGMSNQAEGLLV